MYEYHVDTDERGGFRARLINPQGADVMTLCAGNELADDETSMVDDGWMRHMLDTDGLATYCRNMGIIPDDARIIIA